MEGELVWEQQTRMFNPIVYSFKPVLGLVDERTNGDYIMGEVTSTEEKIPSPGSVWLLGSHTQEDEPSTQQSVLTCKSFQCLTG